MDTKVLGPNGPNEQSPSGSGEDPARNVGLAGMLLPSISQDLGRSREGRLILG